MLTIDWLMIKYWLNLICCNYSTFFVFLEKKLQQVNQLLINPCSHPTEDKYTNRSSEFLIAFLWPITWKSIKKKTQSHTKRSWPTTAWELLASTKLHCRRWPGDLLKCECDATVDPCGCKYDGRGEQRLLRQYAARGCHGPVTNAKSRGRTHT